MTTKTKYTTEKSKKLWERFKKATPPTLGYYSNLFVEKGRGARMWDVDGNEYLDFVGGIGALAVGHNHPKVVEAVKAQADKLIHTSVHVAAYQPYLDLAEAMIARHPGKFEKKAIFFNSGAEAVENSIKAAKIYTKRQDVVAFDLSFHGRTWMAVSLTGKYKTYREGLDPTVPRVHHAPFPYTYRPPKGVSAERVEEYCLGRLEHILTVQTHPEKVAAIITEPVQGEGGFIVPTPNFFKGVRELCDKYGIVFIQDEVQAGFGRTGKFWAHEHFPDSTPDLIVTAKGLAGGMPLSGVVGRAEVLDAGHEGSMGSTYGGHPMSCASALAVLDIIDSEKLVDRAKVLGSKIQAVFDALADEHPNVGESRGLGSMRGIELVRDKKTKEPVTSKEAFGILAACREKGLFIIKAGIHANVIRTLVPLVISDDELERGLSILDGVVRGFKAK